jgi:hypothetical protein
MDAFLSPATRGVKTEIAPRTQKFVQFAGYREVSSSQKFGNAAPHIHRVNFSRDEVSRNAILRDIRTNSGIAVLTSERTRFRPFENTREKIWSSNPRVASRAEAWGL